MARLERIQQMKTLEELVNPKWFCQELFGDRFSDKNILIQNLCVKQKNKINNSFNWCRFKLPLVYIYDIYQISFWYGEDFSRGVDFDTDYFDRFLTKKLEKIDSIDDFTFLTDSVANIELVEFLQENEIHIKDTEKVKDNLKYIIFFIATAGYNDGVNRGKKRIYGV